MRLNVDNYRAIIAEKGILEEEVRKSIGLSQKTFSWILENKFIECETLELIADVIGVKPSDITLPDHGGCFENVIEWIKDRDRATLTLSQRRTITRVKKLAGMHPEECQIVAVNKDGSICAHVPVSWIKISPPAKKTEKQLEAARKTMNDLHSKRVSVTHNLV
ncbi:MAG: helix-turn-helix domain-containing protein [Lachnospiraceae bacterium]